MIMTSDRSGGCPVSATSLQNAPARACVAQTDLGGWARGPVPRSGSGGREGPRNPALRSGNRQLLRLGQPGSGTSATRPHLGGYQKVEGHRATAILLLLAVWLTQDASGLSQNHFVSETRSDGSFCSFAKGEAASIFVETNDWPGVIRAATDLHKDIRRVSGTTAALTQDPAHPGRNAILVGTIGRSTLINQLVRERKLDVAGIAGKWEASLIQVVIQPLPGVESALVIAGSDKRGTIYGVYDLSEQMGVSPWHWWADVPVKRHSALYVKAGCYVQGPPAVKYRGIFINDEGPCLMTWAREKYGELNHRMYTNVFELILRLKGNYLWPAMWDNSFATDDLLNAKLADEYGVVIGSSHHEPMMRAWKEWERAGNRKGSWDYAKNEAKLSAYWTEGLRRTRNYDKVITIGMRGDGDEPMTETESIALLERVVAHQRRIMAELLNPNVAEVPQVWALYKEVQGYYERGMRVPDDVTLLWCDDNWGNLRRLPTAEERKRSGGAGIYYHLDYVGGPRNYKWLNTVPIPKIWEQMNLARHYGADRLWIVNVGDIKPEEVPLEFFLALAWNPDAWPKDRLADYLKLWAEREFGPEYAIAIADIVAHYAKFNGRRKPELLEPGTFSLENYGEADRVLADWKGITGKADSIYAKLPQASRDAFYQLVLYPTKASSVVNELYIAVAKNRWYASRGDARANDYAKQARDLFRQDAELSNYYNHKLAGGKWNHMMDQTHIGYTGWQEPETNAMPGLVGVTHGQPRKLRVNRDQEGATKSEIRNAKSKTDPSLLSSAAPPEGWRGFVESDGYVSIEAEHFTRKTDAGSARWEVLPDHGRTLSGMAVFPVTAPSAAPPGDSPCLEYQMWLTSNGTVEVTSILSPCLNFAPHRGARIAMSFDDEAPEVITVVPKGYTAGDGNRDWEEAVKDSVRKVKTKHAVAAPGAHTFKVWMVDPGVVVQKIVVDCGGMKPSYLGPPESLRR